MLNARHNSRGISMSGSIPGQNAPSIHPYNPPHPTLYSCHTRSPPLAPYTPVFQSFSQTIYPFHNYVAYPLFSYQLVRSQTHSLPFYSSHPFFLCVHYHLIVLSFITSPTPLRTAISSFFPSSFYHLLLYSLL